ncbi:MAG: DMT family transporter [Bacteroidales bacterium]|nr:DMT family transporter [Bacteroidales bacterium]
MKLKGYLYGCISSASYGLIPLFAVPMMRKGMDIDSILSYRFACASLVMCIMLLIRKISLRITLKEFFLLAILGTVFASSSQFLFLGYNYLTVGIASTILFTYPAFVALIMFLLFKERIRFVTLASIVLAFIGVALLYLGDGQTGPVSLLGVIIILLSSLSYGVYMIIVNKSRVKTMNGTKLTFYAMMFSSFIFTAKALIANNGHLASFPDFSSVVCLLSLALVPTIISGITMVKSVHYVGSTITAVLGAMEPLTAVLVGIIAFSEKFTTSLAVGMALIIGAVTIIVLADRKDKNNSTAA